MRRQLTFQISLGKQQLDTKIQTCSVRPSFARAEPLARSPHVDWPFLLCTYGDSSAVEPSTAVRRVAISGLRKALEIMESNPLASDEKADGHPEKTQLFGGRSVIRTPPVALSTPRQLPMSSFKVLTWHFPPCLFPLILTALLLVIRHLEGTLRL